MEVAALIISIVAALLAGWSAWQTHRSANAAKRSADASERSATASEGALAEARRSADATVRSADAAERSAAAAEAVIPRPPLPVQWTIIPLRRYNELETRYALRNTGTETATGVVVHRPPDMDGGISIEIPPHGIRPGVEVQFEILIAVNDDDVHELMLTWDGQDEPFPVPVPAV